MKKDFNIEYFPYAEYKEYAKKLNSITIINIMRECLSMMKKLIELDLINKISQEDKTSFYIQMTSLLKEYENKYIPYKDII